MATIRYSADMDELEQAAGCFEMHAKMCLDKGETTRAAFFFGCMAGVDQLSRRGKPEDAHFRVMNDLMQVEEILSERQDV